ncbi:MAG: methyltransferase domain-containing protein [Chloroflexi bacterium]|nr:methyltransferase domain-containing protein [Chloroflexota bacterium]
MTNTFNTESDWLKDSRRFDEVADGYDAYRPAYPEKLIDALIAMTGIRPDSKILEIGSGTGKATLMLARRGFAIRCIEPGQNLVAIAARKLKHFPRIEFETVAFEHWHTQPGEFALALSAQAFHWVPKEIGYAQAARALNPNGHLALFWNMYPDPASAVFLELHQVYQERAPALADRSISCEDLIRERERDIEESGFFNNVKTSLFPWSARYDTRQYLGLLSTYSDHLRLSDEERTSLFDGIAEVIDRHGGYLEKLYVAALYIAQKSA